MKRIAAIAAIVGLTLPVLSAYARAADLVLLEGNALNAVMEELGPQFEKATGNKIVATLGTSAQLKARVDGNEPFDAVIMTKALLDQLAAQGKVADFTTRADRACRYRRCHSQRRAEAGHQHRRCV